MIYEITEKAIASTCYYPMTSITPLHIKGIVFKGPHQSPVIYHISGNNKYFWSKFRGYILGPYKSQKKINLNFFDKRAQLGGVESKLCYLGKIIEGAHLFNPSTKGEPESKDE